MRKPFKRVLRGLVELIVVFTAIFITPAVIAAMVNLSSDVYFSCVHHPSYAVVMTVIGICFCLLYMSLYQDEKA